VPANSVTLHVGSGLRRTSSSGTPNGTGSNHSRAVPPATLRIASWNIHRCIGTDGRHDPDRVAAVLREMAADVVGLQEVSCRRSAGGIDQLAYLAQATGLEPILAPTVCAPDWDLGNALLTSRPIVETRQIDLSVGRREPRGALDVTLDSDGARVRVVVTHLGLRGGDRRRQVATLLELLADVDRLVLLGDFNEWFPRSANLRRVHATFGKAIAVRTFPSGRPLLALDRIWVRPQVALTGFSAHVSPLSRVASDHLPVCGTIVWPGRDGSESQG
jgi:endonuclease/exonuclease/phosphatase family metal-dependent hydrolase